MFAFTAQSFSARNVPCKSCGNEESCNEGNSWDTGFPGCRIVHWNNPPYYQPSRCILYGEYGDCG